MKNLQLLPAALALLVAGTVLGPALPFVLTGFSLDFDQRDVRVFNNFQDASANDNQTPHPNYPGALGAEMSIWKGVAEWGSGPHGDGSGDPTQPNLGDGGANFDAVWQGDAVGIGSVSDNVVSALISCGGGVIVFTEGGGGGWRMRFCDLFQWDDGPGAPVGGAFDIQGVMTHEYGHLLGLGASSVPGATMGQLTPPLEGRSIEADDIAGIQAIYGVASGAKPLVSDVTLTLNLVTVSGANFEPTGNELWFTNPGGGGDPLVVTGVPSSSNGTLLSLFLPAGAGAGDVFVKVPGGAGNSLSNGYPFDPAVQDCQPLQYCVSAPNSIGMGAFISSFGTTSVFANDFGLSVGGGIPMQFGLFYYGPEQTQVPFGDGFQCVAAGATGTVRLNPPQLTDPLGGALRLIDMTQPPADSGPGEILVGSVFYFQFWYRDPTGPGGTGFNLSDGLRVEFCP